MKDITIKFPNLQEREETLGISRDFFEGTEQIKYTNKKKYFSQGTQESDEGWEEKIASTSFTNYYQAAIMGLSGMATQQEPKIEGFDKEWLKNVDDKGTGFSMFMKKSLTNSLVAGIEFISIDQKENKGKLFFKRYKYDNLMSYYIDEKNVLQEITFKEVTTNNKGGEYREVTKYLRFMIGGGEVWWGDDAGGEVKVRERWTNTLDFIPIVSLITGKEVGEMAYIPPLFDLATECVALLRESSKMANLTNIISKPVLFAYGYAPQQKSRGFLNREGDKGKTSTVMGAMKMLLFKEKGTSGIEFASPDPLLVEAIDKSLTKIGKSAEKMAFDALTLKDGSKTTIDAKGNQSKSTSFLTDIASELEEASNKLLTMAFSIQSKKIPSDFVCEFKKDFNEPIFDKDKYEFMLQLWSNGGLSSGTLLEEAKRQRVFPKDFKVAEEVKKASKENEEREEVVEKEVGFKKP